MKLLLFILSAFGIAACLTWLIFDLFRPLDLGGIISVSLKGILMLMLAMGMIINSDGFRRAR